MANLHDQGGRRRTAAPAGLLLSTQAHAAAATSQVEWSHHCSACGKCCNSPPLLSVPELFRHQHTFFGCLMLQRVKPAAENQLSISLLHRIPGSADYVSLATQAFDLETSARCPALNAEQRCSLHEQGKPAICRVVPFDALFADSAQHLVLARRAAEAHYVGSDCISPGLRPGFAVVTRHLQVVDQGARAALAQRREDLAAERETWGNRVFDALAPALLDQSLRLPERGFTTLSLAPVLIALAEVSPPSRARCVTYLEAQLALAERMLSTATAQGHAQRETVQRLAAFSRTSSRLHAVLAQG